MMMKLRLAFRRRDPDLYHEFEESGEINSGRKMKMLFKSKSSRSFFAPRSADGSFPAVSRNSYSGSGDGEMYFESYSSEYREDATSLSHDFIDSSRNRLNMDANHALSPISEVAKLEEDGATGSVSFDLLPVQQYSYSRGSYSAAVEELIDEPKDSVWESGWEPQQSHTEFPPPPSVSTLSADDPGTLATQSITADDSSRNVPDDEASISSSSTEKRDNSSGLFPISECSQSEAPTPTEQSPEKQKESSPKALVSKEEIDPESMERELQARLEVIHTLKKVITKQGEVITSQKKTIKRYEVKLDESRNVIKSLYRQHIKLRGDISHLELEAELHEARALWSKQELFTVRTELNDMKVRLKVDNRRDRKCRDDRKETVGYTCLKTPIPLGHNETNSTAASSTGGSSDKSDEIVTKEITVGDLGTEVDFSEARMEKIRGGLEFDVDSTDNTLLFAASSHDTDSLSFLPQTIRDEGEL